MDIGYITEMSYCYWHFCVVGMIRQSRTIKFKFLKQKFVFKISKLNMCEFTGDLIHEMVLHTVS